jgi:UDP-N-acetyl-D-mannosaminuronic acid dehydrogenase
MNGDKHNILILGGGFVGITLAAKLLKKKSINVVIVESDDRKLERFKSQNYGVFEPGLDVILNKAVKKSKLKFSRKIPEDIFNVCFICIGTPKNQTAESSLNLLGDIMIDVVNNMDQRGNIYLRSTVRVGTTFKLAKFILNNTQKDIKIFYAPERTAEGVALIELNSLPQILGAINIEDLAAGREELSSFGFSVVEASSTEEAEFIKLICNVWRDSVFALSNEFAVFAENLRIDISKVILKANFNYPRGKIPLPGPVGGPCLSKDTYILLDSLNHALKNDSVVFAARKRNESMIAMVLQKISTYKLLRSDASTIVFLGSAFKGKPKTNDFRDSLTKIVIENLLSSQVNLKIGIWDPTIDPIDLYESSNFYIKQLEAFLPDIVVIGNNSDLLFSDQVIRYLQKLDDTKLIIDMWGITNEITQIRCKVYVFGEGSKNR